MCLSSTTSEDHVSSVPLLPSLHIVPCRNRACDSSTPNGRLKRASKNVWPGTNLVTLRNAASACSAGQQDDA